MEQVKKAVKFYPMIDTERNFPGKAGEFTTVISDLVTGAVIANAGTGTATELIHDANGDKGTTDGAAAAGETTATLASGNTLVKGDVFDDGAGNLYTVKSASDTSIGFAPALVAEIADAVELNQVGNTGSYTFECQVDDVAKVSIDVIHPELGNVPFKYEVVDAVLQDAITAEDTHYESLVSKLDSLGANIVMKAVN
jgi:hypothetical protein